MTTPVYKTGAAGQYRLPLYALVLDNRAATSQGRCGPLPHCAAPVNQSRRSRLGIPYALGYGHPVLLAFARQQTTIWI